MELSHMMASLDDSGGAYLDEKLAQLRAEFGEDIAVYDFGDDGMDTLGGALEEDMNDFNDETFGADAVGKDFDFSGSTAQFLGSSSDLPRSTVTTSTSTWPIEPDIASSDVADGRFISPDDGQRPVSWGVNLIHDPLLGPNTHSSHRNLPSSSSRVAQGSNAPPKGVKVRSLEEIEAELRGHTIAARPMPPSTSLPRALTLEEVEAEMLKNARVKPYPTSEEFRISTPTQSRAQLAQQVQMQHFAAAQRNGTASPAPIFPVSMTRLGSGQSPPVSLPALTHPAHPSHPQHSEWLRLQQQQQHMYTNVVLQQVQSQHVQARSRVPSMSQLPTSHVSTPLGQSPILPSQALPTSAAMHQSGSVPIGALFQTTSPNSGSASAIDDLRSVAEARIQEHERQEALRRRKAAKIAEMAKYNNLMTQGDKDFITRIQVSQLVNPSHGQAGFDPYADDFYFHVYSAIRASRLAAQQQLQAAAVAERRMSTAASGLGYRGPGGREPENGQGRNHRIGERRLTRRDHAMIRMAQNVQRIVDHAKERPKMSQLSLEGALGKIALRTRSAPRQLLQVQPAALSDDLANAAGGENHPGTLTSVLPKTAPSVPGQPAMSRRQVLMSLERLYSVVLEAEQLRRTQPIPLSEKTADSASHDIEHWEAKYAAQKERIWKQLRVLDPLGTSRPHPFISFLSATKGKRLLPRMMRLLTREQSLQVLTLLVATFETVDVVVDAPLLDLPSDARLAGSYPADRRSRSDLETETDLFMNTVVSPMMTVINETPLELIAGLVSLMIERNDLMYIARSKPGVAFLTLFLSRAEILKNASSPDPNTMEPVPRPTDEALVSWQSVFDQLFVRLSGDFSSLFPSTRAIAALPFGTSYLVGPEAPDASSRFVRSGLDSEDEPVWQLMAALSVSTDADGQQTLVGGLRDKVLENVMSASKNWVPKDVAELKIRNVNLLLHALGLDSSMINL